MSFKIVTAEERMAQKSGIKALIIGPSGIGKTSLLRTLPAESTLFFDLEAGALAVQDYPVDQMSPKTWPECRDLACMIGGPNPALSDDEAYSQAHYDALKEKHGDINLAKYETVFVDSITVASRLCFKWAEQQPVSFNKQGKKDLLGTYGEIARQMMAWVTQLQHTKGKNVIFLAIQDVKTDDFNRQTYHIQMEGGKAGREIPGIVDQVITYTLVNFGEDDTRRAFVNKLDNPFGYIAKDRSGRLDMYEKPHLGELFAKITTQARQPIKTDAPVATTNAQQNGKEAA